MRETYLTNAGPGKEDTPVAQMSKADHGAETARNYRYQAGYAIVLLAAAAAGKNDLASVWCEQEDDILGQTRDNYFDAYQIKTRKPETGPWAVTDEPLVKAIKTFVRLNGDYPKKFRRFYFVSNTNYLETTEKKREHLCPARLATSIKQCLGTSLVDAVTRKSLDTLVEKTGVKDNELFEVLKRLFFVAGPSRDAFEAELAQNHLPQLGWCQLIPSQLEGLVEKLVQMALRADSRASQDPARHYACLNGKEDPQLRAKRITVETFILTTKEYATAPFRYLTTSTSKPLERDPKKERHFDKKLKRGGLEDIIDTFRAKMLGAEQRFLEMVAQDPKLAEEKIVQIERVVQDECEQAQLRARQGRELFGECMLIRVQDRLEQLAKEDPAKVHGQPAEVLNGMAGLLTENCTVWWSEKFDLEEGP